VRSVLFIVAIDTVVENMACATRGIKRDYKAMTDIELPRYKAFTGFYFCLVMYTS